MPVCSSFAPFGSGPIMPVVEQGLLGSTLMSLLSITIPPPINFKRSIKVVIFADAGSPSFDLSDIIVMLPHG
jgi:hypothetical protein